MYIFNREPSVEKIEGLVRITWYGCTFFNDNVNWIDNDAALFSPFSFGFFFGFL